MMQYQIFIEKRAQKFIKKLSKQNRVRLLNAISNCPRAILNQCRDMMNIFVYVSMIIELFIS